MLVFSFHYNIDLEMLFRKIIIEGLSEKSVANVFWNGQMEQELREQEALDMFKMYHHDADREAIIEHIDLLRTKTNYVHCPEDCTDDCKARGTCNFNFQSLSHYDLLK